MKNTLTLALVLAFVTITLTGCATIFKGADADIQVNSNPSGASIFVNNINKGTTPTTLALKRNQNHLLTFKMDGYNDVTVEVNQKFDIATTIVGNIFSWSLLGVVVDVATGAAYSLEPAVVQANLSKLQAAGYVPVSQPNGEDTIHVMMITEEQWSAIQGN